MSREARILIVLMVLAGGAVVSLSWMARRYAAAFDRRTARHGTALPARAGRTGVAAEDAQVLIAVDRFLEVRRELREAAEASDGTPGAAELRARRDASLRALGWDLRAYEGVRARYRTWRAGRPVERAWADAFARRRPALDAADLGRHEPLDS